MREAEGEGISNYAPSDIASSNPEEHNTNYYFSFNEDSESLGNGNFSNTTNYLNRDGAECNTFLDENSTQESMNYEMTHQPTMNSLYSGNQNLIISTSEPSGYYSGL